MTISMTGLIIPGLHELNITQEPLIMKNDGKRGGRFYLGGAIIAAAGLCFLGLFCNWQPFLVATAQAQAQAQPNQVQSEPAQTAQAKPAQAQSAQTTEMDLANLRLAVAQAALAKAKAEQELLEREQQQPGTAAPASANAALVATTSVAQPSAASAAQPDPAAQPGGLDILAQAKKLISGASHNSVEVLSVFSGPDGMVGAITESNKRKSIAWLSPHAKVVFPGTALDADGHNVTEAALAEQHVYMSASNGLSKMIEPGRRGILVGTAGPILNVFLDPNCIFCHKLYLGLKPYVESGKVRVRYVMVAIVKPDTARGRAATILTSANPAQALDDDETRFDEKTEDGGASVLANIPADIGETITSNTTLMGDMGITGTPASVFCTKDADKPGQNKVVMRSGWIEKLDGFLPELEKEGHAGCN